MFPKHYKIAKSPEQLEEKKLLKKNKKKQKLIKEISNEGYDSNKKYFDQMTKHRSYINSIKDTHCYSDPLKRLIRISKETEIESKVLEAEQNYQGPDFDPFFEPREYHKRPGGMALLKQIELELQSRLIDDHKNYKDDIILKHYKRRRKKNKKKRKKDLESILHLND